MSEMENNTSISNAGDSEQLAREEGWSNTDWLRYRITGLTPSDSRAIDDGNFDKREQAVFDKVMETSKAIEDAKKDAKKDTTNTLEVPSKNDFFQTYFGVINSTENLHTLSAREQQELLDAQFDQLIILDNLSIKVFGIPYINEPEFIDLIDASAKAFSSLLEGIDTSVLLDPEIRAKALRNAFWLNNVLLNYAGTDAFDSSMSKIVRNLDMHTLRAVFEEHDYAFVTCALFALTPKSGKSGLPNYLSWTGQIPEELAIEYGEYLLEPLTYRIANIIERKNIEEVAGFGGTMEFIGRVMGRLRDFPDKLKLLQNNGLDLQQLADTLFSAVFEKSAGYVMPSTSDLAWRRTLRTLEEFYGQDDVLSLTVPSDMDLDWFKRLLKEKPRSETQRFTIALAGSVGVEIDTV